MLKTKSLSGKLVEIAYINSDKVQIYEKIKTTIGFYFHKLKKKT